MKSWLLKNGCVCSLEKMVEYGTARFSPLVRGSLLLALDPGLSHLMYVLKSKLVTALIPLYSMAAMS